MLLQMLRKDFLRKKSITVSLFMFISLSAFLVASGSNMIMQLSQSLNALFTQSQAPHFVQMHAGEVDQRAIDSWASTNSLVQRYQIASMLNIDGLNLFLGNSSTPDNNSVMDHYFVQQNRSFDLLLNLESKVIEVAKGEIAVPIYYKQHNDLKLGDKVTIADQAFRMELTVVDFVRDVQMNPSIIHSKRFVIHEEDWSKLQQNVGEVEYQIAFQLKELSQLNEFRNAYQASTMPKLGPTIDYPLFKVLNAITDGIVAVVIILVSLLLSIIAILCLRFTILAAIEEDYREIGVMKAIGIQQRDIQHMYLLKYIVMAAAASIVGYAASLFLQQLFTANMLLYIGTAPKSMLLYIVSLMAVALQFLIVVGCCRLTLRRFNRITAVEALRSGTIGDAQLHKKYWSLHKSRWLNVPIFLGFRDVLVRLGMYRLLLFVFIISSFIILVPINLLHTIQSPGFNTYMGIERSDLRVDMQYSDHIMSDFNQMAAYMEQDKDVERFSPLLVSSFKVLNSDDIYEDLVVETGDFSLFPLDYLKGAAPVRDHEIALSYLNGKDLGKKVGDSIRLVMNGQEQEMTVSGIYQDVTNGGRTAKAVLPIHSAAVLRYKVSIDVHSDVSISAKKDEYAAAFYPAKVTDLADYVNQTLSNTIEQLRLITRVAAVIAILVSILITALFVRMLVAKDAAQIAIMKSIGFSLHAIRMQYVTRTLVVSITGIIIGTIAANTAGQSMAGALLSFMGAAQIKFVIEPVQAYIIVPIILIMAVAITTLMSIAVIRRTSIAEMNAN